MGTAWHATLTQRSQPTKYTPSWQRLPTGSDAPAGQRASRATRPATSQKLHRNDPGNMTKSLRHQQNSPDPNQVGHLWEVPDPWRLSRGDLWYQGVGNSTPLGARWGLPNIALSRKGEHYFQFIFSFISCPLSAGVMLTVTRVYPEMACLLNILAFALLHLWAAPLKLNPDREPCFSDQVSVSNFWTDSCSAVESTGSCIMRVRGWI